jgi:hypothetical protein
VGKAPIDAGLIKVKAIQGAIDRERSTPMKEVIDGASHTILAIEDCGRPEHWVAGHKRGPDNNDNGCSSGDVSRGVTSGGAWADPKNEVPLHGFDPSGLRCPGPCAVNCTNNNELYSFHPSGAQVVLVDNSVHFLVESTDIKVYAALITRAGSEEFDMSDF